MNQLLSAIIDLIFPPCCPICKHLGEISSSQRLCPQCQGDIKLIISPLCTICGLPFTANEGEDHLCGNCLTEKRYFTVARAVGVYQGTLQKAIPMFKYRMNTPLTKTLGDILITNCEKLLNPYAYDLLIPVPLHRSRLRERGFNQALILAREVENKIHLPLDYLNLQRIRDTQPQTSLKEKERKKNVRGAFRLREERKVKDKRILLVDDVYTTGATVNECSRVLKRAGTKRVDVLTLARAV
ncbi:MAG: ComF family protein [Deltaproteobacteria bacterium]|nr:MAG: ComF family protein [Deltaproteobacteria bacterium]